LLASAVSALLLADDALAKFTCDERGQPPDTIALRGLPASPIAGRSYPLLVTLPTGYGANPAPYLGGQYCGTAGERATVPGLNGSVRRVGGNGSRVFALELRFPRPGPWALSFMDLDGTFYDFGLRRVKARAAAAMNAPATARTGGSATTERPGATRAARAAGGTDGSRATSWLLGGTALAIATGSGLAALRRRRAR
jgi:hypothetical protein